MGSIIKRLQLQAMVSFQNVTTLGQNLIALVCKFIATCITSWMHRRFIILAQQRKVVVAEASTKG